MTHLSDSALLTRLTHAHKHGNNTDAMIDGAVSDRYLTAARGEVLRDKLAQRLADEQCDCATCRVTWDRLADALEAGPTCCGKPAGHTHRAGRQL
jgi:hypothetical protein